MKMSERKLIFENLELSIWSVGCGLAVVSAFVLILVLMRYERRLVPWRTGWALLFLRFATLAVVFLTLMQPILRWVNDEEEKGRILIAFDLSRSMAASDPHAARAEKLRWAKAMGMIGNDVINEKLDRWIADLERGSEPVWVDAEETNNPKRRAKLEKTRKEMIEEIFQQIDGISRRDLALNLLMQGKHPLFQRLSEIADLEVVVFAGETESSGEKTLPGMIQSPPQSLVTDVTDLSQALNPTDSGENRSKLLGVILFSDGRDNSGRDLVSSAARLKQLSAPVYPVLLGSVLKPKDIFVSNLNFPATVFKDDKPILKAAVSTVGFLGEEITVHLDREGKETVTKKIVPQQDEVFMEFELDATEIGRKEYSIRAEVLQGETRDDNNTKEFAISVVDDKVRVLMLEGEARWEFRFIDNAFFRDDRVISKRVVYRQPYLGILEDSFFPSKLKLPQNAADPKESPFAEPDMVIVGDIAPSDLSEEGWKLLEKFVSEAGGTLVLQAGKRFLPRAYNSHILDAMLPITNLKELNIGGESAMKSPRERGFHLRLTPDGLREEMFQFDVDPNKNRAIWSQLPGHLWGMVGEAKPAATVLAYAMQSHKKIDLQEERRSAVIVRQQYGFGQVVWIGIDSTWRWRHRTGDKYHHRFWGQLGRWAASHKALAGNEHVKFGPERTDIEVGEDAVMRARWTGQFLKAHPRLKAEVHILRVDADRLQPFSVISLKPEKGRPFTHLGRAFSLPEGKYQLKLVAPDGSLPGPDIVAPLYVRERLTTETMNLTANRQLMTQIAQISRGKLFLPDEIEHLPEQFQKPERQLKVGDEIELWDHWLVMVLFFGLLMTEWVVRRLNGLP